MQMIWDSKRDHILPSFKKSIQKSYDQYKFHLCLFPLFLLDLDGTKPGWQQECEGYSCCHSVEPQVASTFEDTTMET